MTLTLQILIASTRPGRKGPLVADWFHHQARAHDGFAVELVDLKAMNLPLLDESQHPRLQRYEHAHTKAWSETVQRADAYVFVTPEYDFFPPASLINAMQCLSREWAHKPVGLVSYGGISGGLRSAQVTKLLATSLKMMPLPEAVVFPRFTQHIDQDAGEFRPDENSGKAATTMLDELARWAEALKPLRDG